MPSPHATTDPKSLMRGVIQRIATGPELSKDLSAEEARAAMSAILTHQADPIQAGIFLIALRMKREADDELRGILDALRDFTTPVVAAVDEVVDIADPYDGYNRCLPVAPFLPALLAECGLPAMTQGAAAIGPKFGVTHRAVLAAAGVAVDLSTAQAAARLADPALGWAYLDQQAFCPALHGLVDLRGSVVKRQALTTVEGLTRPLQGRRRTHLVTGFVHKPYPRIYALLARHAGFDSALLVRGVEGGVIPSLRHSGVCCNFRDGGAEQAFEIDPLELDINQAVRAVPLPAALPQMTRLGDDSAIAVDVPTTARAAAGAGMAALAGERGPSYDSLVFGAALILWHLRREPSLASAGGRVRAVLDSGRAAARVR